MASRGVDDVLMPGQVLSLQKRIAQLGPERERHAKLLADATTEAAALQKTGDDPKGVERVLKRAARIKVDLAGVTREIDTLNSLVAARLAQVPRQR